MDGMNLQFTKKELDRIKKDIPADPLAYEYFLRSISYELSNEGDRMAIQMINQSIELDSTFAPAYLQLGDRLHRYAQYGLLNPEETARAESAFLKALELNDELINAYGNLAMLYTETNRSTEAVELIKRMLELNPNSAEAHYALGYLYRYAGMNEAAIEQMEKAVSLDPNNLSFRSICATYLQAGMYEKAFHSAGLYAESGFLLHIMGQARFRQGRHSEALEYFNRSIDLDPGKLAALTSMGIKAYIEGKREEGIQAAMEFEEYNIVDAEAWYFFAQNYGILGEKEGCMRCLRKAVDGGFFNYPYMSKDFCLDSVRDEQEFSKILETAREKHLAFKERFF
jgi:tetratricopeptide (TPR) repeat protein